MIKRGDKSATFADVWLDHTEIRWKNHWIKKVLDKIN